MIWNSYLTNDEITKHARNVKNYGLSNPYNNAFTFESSQITSSFILKGDTLALNWEFDETIEATDISLDSTSGSQFEVGKYSVHNFGNYNGQNYPGKLHNFPATTTATIFELMQANIIQRPDSLYGKNIDTSPRRRLPHDDNTDTYLPCKFRKNETSKCTFYLEIL